MIVRKMKERELPLVINLMQDTVHCLCKEDYTPAELAAWIPGRLDKGRFYEAMKPCINYVAVHGGNIAGFISMEKNGYINRLFTNKNFVGQGVGTLLLQYAEKWARENGVLHLSLDSSKTAEGFYLKRGVKKSGISTLKRGDIVFRCTVMKKDLTQGDFYG